MKTVRDAWDSLSGYKTYAGVVGLFVLGGLLAIGAIDQKTFEMWSVILGGWTALGLRSAMNR